MLGWRGSRNFVSQPFLGIFYIIFIIFLFVSPERVESGTVWMKQGECTFRLEWTCLFWRRKKEEKKRTEPLQFLRINDGGDIILLLPFLFKIFTHK